MLSDTESVERRQDMSTKNNTYGNDDHASYFTDMGGDRYGENEDCDRNGKPLFGSDMYGVWWGTEEAAWVLSNQYYSVVVYGFIGPDEYTGYFIGTIEEAREYCETRGVKVRDIESGEV